MLRKMRKRFFGGWGAILLLVLAGCSQLPNATTPATILAPASASGGGAVPSTPSVTNSPIPPSLTPTATMTPTPTLALPVSVGTPYPVAIDAPEDNQARALRLIAQYGDGVVYGTAYLSNRNAVALATSHGIALYDADTLEPVDFWPTQYLARHIVYANGIVAIASGVQVEVRREEDGEILHTFYMTDTTGRDEYEQGQHGIYTPRTFTEDEKWITALAISPDGQWLAAGSKGLIDVWYLPQGTLYHAESRLLSLRQITLLHFSADSRWLLYVKDTGTWGISDIRMEPWGDPGINGFSLAFSKSESSSPHVFGVYDFVTEFTNSAEGRYYALGSYEGKVIVWKDDYQVTRSWFGQSYKVHLPWRSWDLPYGEVVGIGFDADTVSIVSADRHIEWRDLADEKEDESLRREITLPFSPWKAQPLPHGRWVIVSTEGDLYLLDTDGQIAVQRPAAYAFSVWAAAIFQKGDYVALAGWPADVVIRRIRDGQTVAVAHFTKANPPFTAIAVSPDERYVVVSDWDGQIWRYDLGYTALGAEIGFATPTPTLTPTPDTSTPTAQDTEEESFEVEKLYNLPQRYDLAPTLAISPQGSLMAVGTYWFATYLWNMDSNTLYRSFEWLDGTITHLAFSPDGAYLAGASVNQIIVWQVSGGLIDQIWTKNDKPTMGWVNVLAWRPGEDLELVSGSNDQRWRLWKFRDSSPVLVSPPLGFKVEQVAVSHSGNHVAVGGSQCLTVWNLTNGEWIASARWDNTQKVFAGNSWPAASSPENPPPTLTPTPTLTPSPTPSATAPVPTPTPVPTQSPIYTFMYASAFGQNDQTIITVSSDGVVRIWKLVSETPQP